MQDILFDFISKYISLTEDEKNAIAITHRAYHTKLPDGFKQLDDKWSKFIFGEPGFHFGFNF
jgi:hypothetical protein